MSVSIILFGNNTKSLNLIPVVKVSPSLIALLPAAGYPPPGSDRTRREAIWDLRENAVCLRGLVRTTLRMNFGFSNV